jgi:hypothetical protein
MRIKFRQCLQTCCAKVNIRSPKELNLDARTAFLIAVGKAWNKSLSSLSVNVQAVLAGAHEYDYLCLDYDAHYRESFESFSSAASEAKKHGLHHVGFGHWANKAGKVVSMTVHGKLEKAHIAKRIKRTVQAMKNLRGSAHLHRNTAHAHAQMAIKAEAAGDHKAAAKHIRIFKKHKAQYIKKRDAHASLRNTLSKHHQIAAVNKATTGNDKGKSHKTKL